MIWHLHIPVILAYCLSTILKRQSALTPSAPTQICLKLSNDIVQVKSDSKPICATVAQINSNCKADTTWSSHQFQGSPQFIWKGKPAKSRKGYVVRLHNVSLCAQRGSPIWKFTIHLNWTEVRYGMLASQHLHCIVKLTTEAATMPRQRTAPPGTTF